MTARVRRSTPCPHHPDVRDCGDCVAAAHRRAIAAAEVRVHAAPDRDAGKLAVKALDDANDALDGFNVLRENGIPLMPPHRAQACPSCGAPAYRFRPCSFARCPGRRVRYQLPEVRR